MNRINPNARYNFTPNRSAINECMGDRSRATGGVNLHSLTNALIREAIIDETPITSRYMINQWVHLEERVEGCFEFPPRNATQYLDEFGFLICSQDSALKKVVCAISQFFNEPLCLENSAANASSSVSETMDGNDFLFIGLGSFVFIVAAALIIKHVCMGSKHSHRKSPLLSKPFMETSDEFGTYEL